MRLPNIRAIIIALGNEAIDLPGPPLKGQCLGFRVTLETGQKLEATGFEVWEEGHTRYKARIYLSGPKTGLEPTDKSPVVIFPAYHCIILYSDLADV